MEYICAICNKKHATLDGYVTCVTNCSREAKRAEEERRVAELKKVQKQRKDELLKLEKEYYEAYKKYNSDYGFDGVAFTNTIFPDDLPKKIRDMFSSNGW